jgi:hypothetical protein
VAPRGRDHIDHRCSGHDDVVAAVFGVITAVVDVAAVAPRVWFCR